METILPIQTPTNSAFCHQALVHAILSAYPETTPWLHSNFIQVYCVKNLNNVPRSGTLDFYYHFYGDFHFYEHTANPWLLMNRFPRDVVREKWGGEFNFVIERLKKQEYVFLVLDRHEYYGWSRPSYHPVLVYGFDDEKGIFHIADNNRNGKYSLQTITYPQFLNALSVPEEEDLQWGRPEGICTFRLRNTGDTEQYRFHPVKVARDIQDYLNPLTSDDLMYMYGIQCYDELIHDYSSIKGDDYIDLRPISTMVDHKLLMTQRLQYMQDNGYLSQPTAAEYQEQIEKNLIVARNMLIKYNMVKDHRMREKCIQLLTDTARKEKELLLGVLAQL